MTKLVGYETKKGTFSGDNGKLIEYDNVILHCIGSDNPNVIGCSAFEQKIKSKDIVSILGVSNSDELKNWLDKNINLDFALIGSRPVLTRISLVSLK